MLKLNITARQLRTLREQLTIWAATLQHTQQRAETGQPAPFPGDPNDIATAARISSVALADTRRLLAELPPYLYVFECFEPTNNHGGRSLRSSHFWIAAENETQADEVFATHYPDRKNRSAWERLDPDQAVTVHDTNGVIGSLERSAEDWANTNGKPYLVASTVEIQHSEIPTMELPPLVLDEAGNARPDDGTYYKPMSEEKRQQARSERAAKAVDWLPQDLASLKPEAYLLDEFGGFTTYASAPNEQAVLDNAKKLGLAGEVQYRSKDFVIIYFRPIGTKPKPEYEGQTC